MPLLTQAPTPQEKKKLKAHLVSFVSPSQEYNAALFRKDALAAIEKIRKKSRLPMLVGGTGLYLRALMDGLFEMGDTSLNSKQTELSDVSPEQIRKKLLREQERHGGNYLHERLERIDALSALKIHPNDTRRLVRALEVHHVTGRPLSEQQPNRQGIRELFQYRIFLLDRERTDLYARIEERVDRMIRQGLAKEVKRVLKKNLSRTASMALGIREIGAYLNGVVGATGRSPLRRQEAILLLKQHTRNYAKRQLSWFRHEKDVECVPVPSGESPKKTAEKILRLWKNK